MIEEYGRAPSGRAAAADAVEPISVVSSKASIPNAKRREWAERIANQFESDDVDAIEEGIARGAELAGAPLLRNALTRIAYLRPAGDADTATGTRALVKQMELIALEALGGRQ